ncbi:MAG: hypothetical protein OER04_15305 [Cyclobacteriaceae bacterium]|nr:hypothetical protein [Cyclobacteriaceae bacterium]
MKNYKIILGLLIFLTLSFAAGVLVYSKEATLQTPEFIIYGVVGLIALFSIITVINHLRKASKGITTEDELSRKIKMKAAANAFMASFYLWTMILLFTIDSGLSVEVLLGLGLVGMGILYIGFWFYHNYQGVPNEN